MPSRPDLDEILRRYVDDSLTRRFESHEHEDLERHREEDDRYVKLVERVVKLEVIYREELTDTQKIRITRRGYSIEPWGPSRSEHERLKATSIVREILRDWRAIGALAAAFGSLSTYFIHWLLTLHH